MYKKILRIIFTLASLFLTLLTFAQDTGADKKVDMADALRSNGKIYVVVTVLVIILLGLFFYVGRLDRKISKMEKDITK